MSFNLISLFLKLLVVFLVVVCSLNLGAFCDEVAANYSQKYRPQLHFSPPSGWMNDPNGLVYFNGRYHLFYQFNPNDIVWGPMHWGHASSTDAIHWINHPIALAPNENGTIFSGSAIVDSNNVANLADGATVLVAIFTLAGAVQSQALAFTTESDAVVGWQFYANNPIIQNPGVNDFRDPKVIPYEDGFLMALAVGDKVQFYNSKNLLNWTFLSEFGSDPASGSHGGVWECPDLFKLSVSESQGPDPTGPEKWVLIVNINPGGPNLGSGTQYFVGNWDGQKFVNDNPPEVTLWLDYGPDNYAGVLWNNEPKDRKLFIGWMSSWLYGDKTPTHDWRGQNTIPRVLGLRALGSSGPSDTEPTQIPQTLVTSWPLEEIESLRKQNASFGEVRIEAGQSWPIPLPFPPELLDMTFRFDIANLFGNQFSLCLHENTVSKQANSVCVGFKSQENRFFVDRVNSGDAGFHPDFGRVSEAPRFLNETELNLRIILDRSSLEVFADNGLTFMTALFFPTEPLRQLSVFVSKEKSETGFLTITESQFFSLKSIWEEV